MPTPAEVLSSMPLWAQVGTVYGVPAAGIATVLLNHALSGRRQLRVTERAQETSERAAELSEDKAAREGQSSAMKSVLEAAGMVPELVKTIREQLAQHDELIKSNAAHGAEIVILQEQVRVLMAEVEALKRERDGWREQAAQVPVLIGQLSEARATAQKMQDERDALILERDALRRQLLGMDVARGRRATDAREVVNADG